MIDVTGHGWDAAEAALPAWSLPKDAVERISLPSEWPEHVTREWAWGGSTGEGARVCIIDSGVEASHPLVGELEIPAGTIASRIARCLRKLREELEA